MNETLNKCKIKRNIFSWKSNYCIIRSQRSKEEKKTIHKTIKEFFIKSVIGYKVAQNVVNEQEISQNGCLDKIMCVFDFSMWIYLWRRRWAILQIVKKIEFKCKLIDERRMFSFFILLWSIEFDFSFKTLTCVCKCVKSARYCNSNWGIFLLFLPSSRFVLSEFCQLLQWPQSSNLHLFLV